MSFGGIGIILAKLRLSVNIARRKFGDIQIIPMPTAFVPGNAIGTQEGDGKWAVMAMYDKHSTIEILGNTN
jgi:hypothetical protein